MWRWLRLDFKQCRHLIYRQVWATLRRFFSPARIFTIFLLIFWNVRILLKWLIYKCRITYNEWLFTTSFMIRENVLFRQMRPHSFHMRSILYIFSAKLTSRESWISLLSFSCVRRFFSNYLALLPTRMNTIELGFRNHFAWLCVVLNAVLTQSLYLGSGLCAGLQPIRRIVTA